MQPSLLGQMHAEAHLLSCRACRLCEGRTQVVLPDGPARALLAVGETPGEAEDAQGVGFVGAAGRTLDKVLADHGIARSDYARANVVRCRPPGNRRPTNEEIACCAPYLEATLQRLQPNVILAVGESAARTLAPAAFA